MPRLSSSTRIVLILIALGAGIRIFRDAGFIPLPPNVAPISALALFSGALLPRRLTFVVPLTAMLMSDLVIGFYRLPVMMAVYAAFALSTLIGHQLQRQRTTPMLIGASLIGSVLFFLITNGATWAFESMYAHTPSGLFQAYLAGVPFFRNTVLGDLGFTALLFGVYELSVVYLRQRAALTPRAING